MSKPTTYWRYIAVLLGLLLGAFALIWTYTATARPKFLPIEYGSWEAQLQLIRRCDVGEVAILGDSRASVAYVPAVLGMRSRNLALTGSTPVEGYYEIAEILKCPNPPKAFVLSYSGYHFENMTWFWERSARYGLLSFENLQEISKTAKQVNDRTLYHGSFGSEPPPAMKNWLYANHFPPLDYASLLAARGGFRGPENARIARETLAQGGQHVLGQGRCAQTPAWEAGETAFRPDPLILTYFERMVRLLEARGAKVLLVSVPISQPSYDLLKPGYADVYQAFLAAEVAHHPGMRMEGPVFPAMDVCAFSDASHLNQQGAEAFSRAIGPVIADRFATWNAAAAPAAPPSAAR